MVGLVRSRDKMLQDYINGGRPMFMEVYDKERNSENWRVTKLVEGLCEYIKYLENEWRFQMTLPNERYQAVQRTQKFLNDILWGKYEEIETGSPAWDEARRCLKHFPWDFHMEDVAETSEHFEK